MSTLQQVSQQQHVSQRSLIAVAVAFFATAAVVVVLLVTSAGGSSQAPNTAVPSGTLQQLQQFAGAHYHQNGVYAARPDTTVPRSTQQQASARSNWIGHHLPPS
jgi:hypothetical protein